MLGSDPNGLENGRNPVKALVLRRGVQGCLLLIAGVSAGALSWYAGPECVRVQEGCGDHQDFCHSPGIFSPATRCRILAESCMQTCGCCSENPTSWCPNKVNTVKSILADNALFLEIFGGTFTFLMLFSYWRLCCSAASPEKRRLLVISGVTTIVLLLLYGCIWMIYALTDCQDKFRGVSDVLMVVSTFFLLYALILILIAGASMPSINQYGALLANMAACRRSGDPNILVLEVSAERTRRFITEEEQHSVHLTVQTSRNAWISCCRVWLYLVCAVLVAFSVYVGGVQVLKARGVVFPMIYLLIFCVLAIYLKIRRTQAYLDYKKRQAMRAWADNLQGPQQLVFFCNTSTAGSAGNPGGVALKSLISFGSRPGAPDEVNSKSVFLFEPTAAVVPGAFVKTVHTRILPAAGQSGDVLECKTVVNRTNPGLIQSHIHVEVASRLPLEDHQVAQVRQWLEERRAMFEFETGAEVELMQP